MEVIGRGNFGAVHKVRHKPTGNLYALKKIPKLETILYNSVEQVLS